MPVLTPSTAEIRSETEGPISAPSTPAVRAVGVTRLYGSGDVAVRALDGVDLDVEAHRLTAIMGASGSGKSTLLYCLAGLERVTAGRVVLGDAIDLSTLSDAHLARLRRDHLGFVFQSFNLVPTLTAMENVVLPLHIARRRPDAAWLQRVVDMVGLRNRWNHRPSELSGGEQQRVAVARALASRPQIVFADEPTGNLDSRAGTQLLGFLRQSVDEVGQTVVMVTHDPAIAAYGDRAVFLRDGQLVDEVVSPTPDTLLARMRSLAGGARC